MQRKRRRLYPIVDKNLQYRFLAIIVCYSLIIVVVLALFLLVPDIFKLFNEELSLDVRAAAANKVLTLHSRVWPAILAIVCVLGLHSIKVFHRIIGPLYRFRWACSQVRDGDLSFVVRLRKKDYLHREEDAFNEMIQVLAEKWANMQRAGLDTLRSLTELERTGNGINGWQEAEKQMLHTHRRQLQDLMEAASYFRIKSRQEFAEKPTDVGMPATVDQPEAGDETSVTEHEDI